MKPCYSHSHTFNFIDLIHFLRLTECLCVFVLTPSNRMGGKTVMCSCLYFYLVYLVTPIEDESYGIG